MNARRGETQAGRAANAAGVPFCLSTVSVCPIGEVTASAIAPFWFQLYMIRDRGLCEDLLAQARAAGCTALLFTVDMPLPGTRYRDFRSGLAGQPGWRGAWLRGLQGARRPRWAVAVGLRGRPHHLGNVAPVLGNDTGLENFLGWMRANFDARMTWADLGWVRERWPGPLIVKAILDADDARQVVAAGVDGIVVSNHGGRQLDGVPATADALPAIAAAVGDRLTVLADGGVRSGLDVVKLIALGAKGVLLGRAWAWALAAARDAGVAHVLRLVEAEMRIAMALTGCTRLEEITPDILVR